MFDLGRTNVNRYLARRRKTGTLAPRSRYGSSAVKTPTAGGAPARLASHPDATLAEHCAWYEETFGVRVADTTMSRVIRRHLGWTRKKRP